MRLIAVLLSILLALAPASAGQMSLLGAGKAGAAPVSPSYTRGAIYGDNTGFANNSFNSDIGPATATRVILIATYQQNTALSGVTVNGVAASVIGSQGSPALQFWQITGSSPGSGVQSVTLQGGAFFAVFAQVWYMDGLSSTTLKNSSGATGGGTSITTNINITSGDFLFSAAAMLANAPASFSTSTETPASSNSSPFSSPAILSNADWVTTTTNASWAVTATHSSTSTELLAVSFR